jgi:hypothetical protein
MGADISKHGGSAYPGNPPLQLEIAFLLPQTLVCLAWACPAILSGWLKVPSTPLADVRQRQEIGRVRLGVSPMKMPIMMSCNAGMENIYSEHEASVKNGNTFPKLVAANGHTDSHADKARPSQPSSGMPYGMK